MNFQKFLQLVKPRVVVGGLEIGETAIRFFEIKDGAVKKFGVGLEPGVVEDGRVKDRARLVNVLRGLKTTIGAAHVTMPVAVSLPSKNVYTQAFSIPVLNEAGVEEAADLNLRMLSPIDIKTAYYDWQKLGDLQGGQKEELLGAFTPKAVVDDFSCSLDAAGFMTVAVEFPALSVARV